MIQTGAAGLDILSLQNLPGVPHWVLRGVTIFNPLPPAGHQAHDRHSLLTPSLPGSWLPHSCGNLSPVSSAHQACAQLTITFISNQMHSAPLIPSTPGQGILLIVTFSY
jgi:hypothetical protein